MSSSVAEEAPSPAMAKGKRKRERAEQGEKKATKRHRSKSKLREGGGATDKGAAAATQENHANGTTWELVKVDQDEDESIVEDDSVVHSARQAVAWKVSEPMGGRLAAIDPVLSRDENYLILTYETSIQVYSTRDSLLVRKIPISKQQRSSNRNHPKGYELPHILATVSSLDNPEVIWVADNQQSIWKINWKTGDATRHTKSNLPILALGVVRASGAKDKEFLLSSENRGKGATELVVYSTSEQVERSELHSYPGELRGLQSTFDGSVVVGFAENKVVLCSLKLDKKSSSVADLAFELYTFDAPDEVCCIDARIYVRKGSATTKKSRQNSGTMTALDVIIGTARGPIYAYSDVLALSRAAATGNSRERIQPRKHHWHPRAVHSVKWSLDGEYFISGGTENTLVLWQVDTGRREYLPHLPACIETIAVSPLGSSYAITLDDNSAMVLSTSEMTPTTYISGLQSLVLREKKRKDRTVRRVWRAAETINRPLTAAIHPKETSRLVICVGNGQAATNTDSVPSASLVQTFDLSTFQSLSKQPLARTHTTEATMTPKGFPVTEPLVSHISFSSNGEWLASVDEWQPPVRDLESIAEDSRIAETLCRDRKEVHLKFWKVGSQGNHPLDLVSRIDEAHFTTRPESILELAANPKTTMFGTVGTDGKVKLWAPYSQQASKTPGNALATKGQTGEKLAAETVEAWSCVGEIPLAVSAGRGDLDSTEEPLGGKYSAAMTFSEDGSTLFVAYGLADEMVLYIIDASSGQVRNKLPQLVEGEVKKLEMLGCCLIILCGASVVVYDVVEDTVRYTVTFDGMTPSPKLQMTQVAVDKKSKTFALAVPVFVKAHKPKYSKGAKSEIAVFTLDSDQAVLVQPVANLVVALLAMPEAPGYVAVDSAAQVLGVMQVTASNPLAAPLSVLRLDTVAHSDEDRDGAMEVDEDEDEKDRLMLQLGEKAGDDDDDDHMDEDGVAEDEEGDSHNAVVVPERLTRIFDAAPVFALPPIEDLFYQVSGLIASRPVQSQF